jgi:hypothetical protein
MGFLIANLPKLPKVDGLPLLVVVVYGDVHLVERQKKLKKQ